MSRKIRRKRKWIFCFKIIMIPEKIIMIMTHDITMAGMKNQIYEALMLSLTMKR